MKEYLIRPDDEWYIARLSVTKDYRMEAASELVVCWVNRDGGVLCFADDKPEIRELPE